MSKLLDICLLLLLATSALAALDVTWSGYQGLARQPAKVSTYEDAKRGTVTRIEAVADGGYQGALAVFKPDADIKAYAAVEFEIRHNLSDEKTGFILRFEQQQGMFYGPMVAPTPEWQKITLPFDEQNFTPENGNAVTFGEAHEMRLYPYDAMNQAGMFFEIANFRFVPKSERVGPAPIKVMSYTHLTQPTSGDVRCTVLTDGDREQNVFYRQFSEEPDVVFDLGGRYAIDSMTVDAFAAPSHNFSEISIQCSFDNRNWVVGGTLKNSESGIDSRLCSYTFTPAGRPVVGRYVRLRASRPRSDFPVYLSEVSFVGHVPDQQEIAVAAELNYDTGRPMAERNADNYHEVKDGDWRFYVSKSNGILNGVYYRGRLLVERFAPMYTLQSRDADLEVSGYDDVLESANLEAGSITLLVTNPQLPGLAFERTWSIAGNALLEKVVVLNRGQQERYFLRVATEVIFEQQFRKAGFYEMPSSALASGMFRLPAKDVQMDRAMTNIPTLAIENKEANMTVWHTRYRFNDRFAYMDIGTEEDNLQVFRPNGWLLTAATVVPADAPRQSFENRFSVTDGRMLKAYDEYIALPEVAAFRAQIRRPKWLRDIRAGMAFGWEGSYPKSSRRLMTNYKNVFSHRGKLHECELVDMDGIWGDLPVKGPVRGSFGEVRDATEIRERLRGIKAFDPRFGIGLYTWFWSAFPWSTPVKNHPEWFVRTLRNGARASWFPGVNVNYLRFWGIPESRQEAVDQVVNFVNYYEQDSWYVDGGKSGVYAKDWETMRIDDPFGQTDFYLAVRREIQRTNPERIVVFNHCENPIGDMGFLESFGGTLTNEWRRGATLMWKFKMYDYKDPWHRPLYTYWLSGVEGALQNYIAGIGAMGDYSSRDLTARDAPFIGARYDIRTAQLCDAAVSPDWRFDFTEELECMTLTQQNNGWIFMHYHGEEPVVREVSADAGALGMDDPSRPLYMWRYTIRDAREYQGTFGEPQIEKDYTAHGWVAERGVVPEYLGRRPWSERVSCAFEHRPGRAQVLMVSQVPAVVLAVEGDPAHYYLAGQPGVELNGSQDRLTVDNEYNDAVIGIVLDEGVSPASVKVNGVEVPFSVRTDRDFRCVSFKVGQGRSVVDCTYVKHPPAVADALEVKLDGRVLNVRVSPSDAPVQIYNEGTLALSREGSFTLELPDTVRDGEYEVVSGSCSEKVTLKGVGRPLVILPLTVPQETDHAVQPVNRRIRGIEVLSQAHCYSIEDCRVRVDADTLTLMAGTLPYYESHYNEASAAFEMRVRSYLKIRITNGVIHHTRYGYEPQYHFVRWSHPGAFSGLMIDFGSASGYKTRSAAGFGHQNEARKIGQSRPEHWGTGRPANHVFELNRLIHDPDTEVLECWIDLATLGAPQDWDGRIWFAVHQEHLSPDRSFTVEILETADSLPPGAVAVRPIELGIVADAVVHPLNRLSDAGDEAALTPLGRLKPDRGAAELETMVMGAYDDDNIYFFYDCRETDGHLLNCEGGGKGHPWEGDSVEFYVQRTDQPEETLHGIVDANGVPYAENAPFHPGAGKKRVVLGEIPFKFRITLGKPHWQAFVTIPWAALGGRPKTGSEVGFNLMRNRNEQGRVSWYTLSNNHEYLSGDQCRMKLK